MKESGKPAAAGRSPLADHLRFYEELGVAGISRDAAWRARAEPEREDAAPGPAEAGPSLDTEPDEGTRRGPLQPDQPAEGASSSVSGLAELRAYIGHDCTRCKLSGLGRKQIVFGTGNPDADLMFVGEAPGADEDTQGEPFVGRAGQLLTKIIEAMGFTRDQVYIANVIKCRPPGNRAPEPDEIATCEPFLFQQISTIRPKVIVALGTHAAHALLKTDAPISRLRGQVHDFRAAGSNVKLVPTFHPAFLLRSPDRKRDVWEDMKKVKTLLEG